MIVGTCVKVEAELNLTPDSIKILIDDPDDMSKVSYADMTLDTGYTYYYLYQNELTDTPGTYTATIMATLGIYTARSQVQFKLHAHQ
jgi:hypothetical protein